MKKIIFTIILAILAWLSYLNVSTWVIKFLTVGILLKLFMALLTLVLSFVVQKLITETSGSILLKDKIEELGKMASIQEKTTKTLLILFIFYCLFKCENILLLLIYASSVVLDNFLSYFWITFVNKIK
ncbi:hypothetical protein IJ843_00740 [bacterium]|nr:hypothetical protein [bacterium]